MDNQLYKLSKAIIFTDHTGKQQTLLQGQFFHWNQHRFVTAERDLVPIEIARSKVYAAGAKMVPVDGQGHPINMNIVAEVPVS